MIGAAREGAPFSYGSITTGDTLIIMADAMRLLIEVMPGQDDDRDQLRGAVTRYLDSAL